MFNTIVVYKLSAILYALLCTLLIKKGSEIPVILGDKVYCKDSEMFMVLFDTRSLSQTLHTLLTYLFIYLFVCLFVCCCFLFVCFICIFIIYLSIQLFIYAFIH